MRNWQQFLVSTGNNGMREYVKDVWEESKYIKPLEITEKFQDLGKEILTSLMDLTYMDHPVNRRRINPPRVMMRHMAYVVSIKDHESPYGDWMTMIFEAFSVPLVIKKEKNLRNMISLKIPSSPCVSLPRENGIWWIGSGENRRRDDDEATQEEEAEGEDEGNRVDFEREAIIDEASC
ncbi:hypothetical protein Dimus_001005 [Dionaea muscipula]